ncbi:HAD-IIIC family phosphatase [Neptuniibacter sp. QD37_6]|uniref:HAD-IIIC family phosphatase n=1 Tax=Neptuniibacter sp. QD37_6 TaxID=3398210 RepID=UPI0039F57475
MNPSQLIAKIVKNCFDLDSSATYKLLAGCSEELHYLLPRLIRVCSNCPGHSTLFYGQLHALWAKLGYPRLKPSESRSNIVLITDFTADPLIKMIELFAACRGVSVSIKTPSFDAVEMEILNPSSDLYTSDYNMAVVLLSEHWITKYTSSDVLIDLASYQNVSTTLEGLIQTLKSNFDGTVVFGNFSDGAYPVVCSYIDESYCMGRGVAMDKLNALLNSKIDNNFVVCDIKTALFISGGASAVGRRNYFLAKLGYESEGSIAVAREIASTVADHFGQSHRLLALDWDNTLWGGEIAELGAFDVVCGYDSPEANAYRISQEMYKGLKKSGVALAAVSRNDPSVADLIDENNDIKLKKQDFTSIQINFIPKSELISGVCEDINFGAEYFLFIDDSDYELSEVLTAHENIDILRSERSPEFTLERFSAGRFFNRCKVQQEDLEKSQAFDALIKTKKLQTNYKTNDEFLDQLNISLTIDSYSDKNKSRVLQLIKKSNQFNLTTRRHSEEDLKRLTNEQGAQILVVSYSDDFGAQGIISTLILLPNAEEQLEIDTWIMSCRVLNRTVEEGVFQWLNTEHHGKILIGSYIPTAKNKLVKDHYLKLGFIPLLEDDQRWQLRCDKDRKVKNFIKQFE